MKLSISLSRVAAATMLGLFGLGLQAESRVIVPGNPPLTSDIVEKTARLTEWVLDVRFSPQQAREYEDMLARDWPKTSERRGTLAMYDLAQKVENAPEEKRQRAHAAMQQEILQSLRQNSQMPNNRWMLALYDAAHNTPAVTNVTARPEPPAGGVGRVVGKWRATSVSGIQYHNSYTGAPAPTNGSSFFFQFNSDGTYANNGLMQMVMYNCTTTLYSEETGRYRVEGNHISLEPDKGIYRTNNTCAKSQNTERSKTLGNRAYSFTFEQRQSRETLVLRDVAGANKPDYFRREQ